MAVMAKSWKSATLEEVSLNITDGSHNPPKGVESSDYPMLSSRNIFDDEINLDKIRFLTKDAYEKEHKRTNISSGDVLLTIVGTIGRVAIAEEKHLPFTLQRSVAVIRPNPSIVSSRYLMYCLMCMSNDLNSRSRGAAQKGIYLKQLRAFVIVYPDLEEQQRIVSVLDDAFRNIRLKQLSVEQNLNQSEELIQSIFDSMFENADWESSTFDEIATIKGGKRLPKGHTYSNNKTAHPYISVKDFTSDGTIDTTNLKYIDEETFNQISRYTISSNDLYLSIAGTIGKTGIVPVELDGANLTENACKLIFNEGYDTKFVYYFTKTTSFLNQAGLLTKATGQPKLALTRLKQIVIRYPDSLEQETLVKRLDEIVHQSKLVEEKLGQELQNLDELKQSILQEAFNGTL